jgi:hypothetical protein
VTSGAPIYAILVIVWALVLIPMWLRRHDEAQETKSADRFARAMGTLRRSETGAVGAPTPREVVMPARSSASHDTQIIVTGPAGTVTPAALAAARRRRVLGVLVGLLLVTFTVAMLGRLPMWTVAIPALLVGGFLVVARRQVALAADIKRRQQKRATLAEAARAAEARYAEGAGARRGGRAVDPAPMAAPSSRIVASELLDLEHDAADADGSWNAVPTTLPTYVTAPRATRMPRVLDLTHPGQWTGAVMVEQARGTLAAEATAEGEMRVETFEITVPRDPAVRAGVIVEPATYADRYVVDDGAVEALDGEDELDSLLGDPRTGVELPAAQMRRAANG